MKTTAVKITEVKSEMFGNGNNITSKFFIDRIEGKNCEVNERAVDTIAEAVHIANNIAKGYGVKVVF